AAPDHLAICELGVWDHQGPPSGIEQTIISADESESLTEELEENSKAGEQIELEHADSLRISQFDPSNAESTGQAI
ncbi:hypothetical protein, partial [Burkholderia cenocepacia]